MDFIYANSSAFSQLCILINGAARLCANKKDIKETLFPQSS